jgi:hypothetical protein
MGIGRRKVLRRRSAPDDDPRLGKRALNCAERIAILAIVRLIERRWRGLKDTRLCRTTE